MKHRFYIFVLFFLIGTQIVAASEIPDSGRTHPKKLFFAVNAQQGSLLNTHNSTIIKNYYVGIDFRVGWQTDAFNRNDFDCLFRYPYYGFGYYMGNMNGIILGNDEQTGFGKPAALYAFFGSPLYRWNRIEIDYDLSLGLSYNFNAYDPELHPYNILVGSKNNAYINIRFVGKYDLPKHSALSAGVSFQHFSNGSYQKPNKGINLVSATLSYQFGLYKNRDKSYVRFPVEHREPTIEWYLFWANGVRMPDTGFNESAPREGRRWYCTTVSSAVLVQTSVRRKFGLGIDWFYFDWGRYVVDYRAGEEGRTTTTRSRDNMALGAYLAHELGYKKVWFVTDLGFYVADRVGDDPENPWIYERVGIKYQITPRLFAGVFIKAHLAKADYTEWTIGYSLVKSKPVKR